MRVRSRIPATPISCATRGMQLIRQAPSRTLCACPAIWCCRLAVQVHAMSSASSVSERPQRHLCRGDPQRRGLERAAWFLWENKARDDILSDGWHLLKRRGITRANAYCDGSTAMAACGGVHFGRHRAVAGGGASKHCVDHGRRRRDRISRGHRDEI